MLNDMKAEDIVGEYKEALLELYDIGSRKVFYTEIETPYPDGKLIVSTTRPSGVITHVNQAFIDMSGYEEEEIVGAPHSLLRHPDMPAAAFSDLWNMVNQGKKWQGYVKNLRKDGGFYWVNAIVIPNIRKGQLVSYSSIRRKPSRAKVEESIALYAEML